MIQTIKKTANILSTLAVILALALVLLLVAPRVFGVHVFTVLSGSMEPAYPVGSMIYVKSVDPFQLKEGDVISFLLDENTIATHRITGIVPDEEDESVIRFRTKGDANDAEDGSLVHCRNVVGTPIFTIPKLGYFADYIQHPPGMYIAVSAAAIVLLILLLPDLLFREKERHT
ncbi:MAG: signal peptidase I [Anaerovoracaceae bacterium]|nr:signal peptidase I [Anaerovoracaceae bacterium]